MSDNLKIDRPISGDITRGDRTKTAQGTAEEFLGLIDALLVHPKVETVRWEQYTPYFNDGDPCEFTVHEAYIKFEGDDNGGDYEDGYVSVWELTYSANGSYPYRPPTVTDADVEGLADIDLGLNRFEDILRANFGDHARVTATREGFDVEYYAHD